MNRLIISLYLILAGSEAIWAVLPEKPNVVVVFTDDQGYSDVGCYGAEGFETPHLDKMAKEGTRFTSFYVSSPVCSPSRAALLTGSYHLRAGVKRVFFPTRANKKKGNVMGPGKDGMHPGGGTIAEVLKKRGYATACIGKWHLGDAKPFLPTRQGFDYYFGIPYSNDMGWWEGLPEGKNRHYPPIPLLENEKLIETDPDQRLLTKRYTEKAVDFIEKHQKEPFFVYLPHSMPHIPLFASKKFEGKSKRGLYGDVIEEIDWSVGQVLETLKRLELDKKTLVIFTSDNGPWLVMKEHGGSAKPLRDGKMTIYEGGVRVPCIMRWPGQVPAGQVCDEIVSTIDLLPTIAGLAGADTPSDLKIDGLDVWPLVGGKEKESPRKVFFYGTQAVREGDWKFFRAGKYHEVVGHKNTRASYEDARLYNLKTDLTESKNVLEQYPEIAARLLKMLDAHTAEMKREGRPEGHVSKL